MKSLRKTAKTKGDVEPTEHMSAMVKQQHNSGKVCPVPITNKTGAI